MRQLKLERLFVTLILVSPSTIMLIYYYSGMRGSSREPISSGKSAAEVGFQSKPLSSDVSDLMAVIIEDLKKGQDSKIIPGRTFPNVEQDHNFVTEQVHEKNSGSTLLQGKELDSRQDTKASVGQDPGSILEQTPALPLEDATSSKCLLPPKNLQVRPIPQQECGAPHVVMHSGGRLGNKLCQYTSLYLLRHIFGIRVSITENMEAALSRILRNITLPVQDPPCFTKDTERILYDDLYRMLHKAAQVARTRGPQHVVTEPLLKRSYYVFNHPCPRELVMAHRDLVRHVLTFREDLLQNARDNINRALEYMNQTYTREKVMFITVHVRRGDYTQYILNHYNLTQLDEVYFQRAFDFYRKKVVNPVFVVVSEDHKWCREVLQARDVIVAGRRKDAMMDFAVLTLGNHTVISYGTFSFLGAVLGPGNFTHPISDNKNYDIYQCVDSPALHYISRDPS